MWFDFKINIGVWNMGVGNNAVEGKENIFEEMWMGVGDSYGIMRFNFKIIFVNVDC